MVVGGGGGWEGFAYGVSPFCHGSIFFHRDFPLWHVLMCHVYLGVFVFMCGCGMVAAVNHCELHRVVPAATAGQMKQPCKLLDVTAPAPAHACVRCFLLPIGKHFQDPSQAVGGGGARALMLALRDRYLASLCHCSVANT